MKSLTYLYLLQVSFAFCQQAPEALSDWWQKKIEVGDKVARGRAGFVLPYYVHPGDGHCYYIVAQEANGHDNNRFGPFGGRCERHEQHPILTAAREFWQEANLMRYFGWQKEDVQKLIDLKNGNTQAIIANTTPNRKVRGAFYILDFGLNNALKLLMDFDRRLNVDREIMQLAEVKDDDLIAALKQAKPYTAIPVQGHIWHQGKRGAQEETIQLRPLMENLAAYFKGESGRLGRDPRIHFYG